MVFVIDRERGGEREKEREGEGESLKKLVVAFVSGQRSMLNKKYFVQSAWPMGCVLCE